jgi:hypothetical protein
MLVFSTSLQFFRSPKKLFFTKATLFFTKNDLRFCHFGQVNIVTKKSLHDTSPIEHFQNYVQNDGIW